MTKVTRESRHAFVQTSVLRAVQIAGCVVGHEVGSRSFELFVVAVDMTCARCICACFDRGSCKGSC